MTTQTKLMPFTITLGTRTFVRELPVRYALTRHGQVKVWPAYSELAPDVAEQVAAQLKEGPRPLVDVKPLTSYAGHAQSAEVTRPLN